MTKSRRKQGSKRRQRTASLWAAALASTLFAGWLGGCDALVGGECLPGFVAQDLQCVPVDGLGGGGTGQGGGGTGQGGGGTGGDGGDGASSGTAGNGGYGASSSGTGNNGQGGTGGKDCVPPEVWCPTGCTDLQTDFMNCGSCGHYCPTELCVDGKCSGSPIGHLVVLGMTYAKYHQPMQHLLGNAVFLPPDDPVRIVEYRKYAHPSDPPPSPPAKTHIDVIVKAEAYIRNRTWGINNITIAAAVGKQLDSGIYDVFLMHDQPLAPAGQLGAFGSTLNNSVQKFLQSGGTVVVLASNDGVNEMPDFLANAGLMQIQSFTPITGQSVLNAIPNDIIGNKVQWPFLAKDITSTVSTMELPGTFVSYVFTDTAMPTAAPVVIHKTFKKK